MGRPIVKIYSNSSCREELTKVQDTYIYKMGNINSVVRSNGVNLDVYIKNSGEFTAYNIKVYLVSKEFIDNFVTEPFDLNKDEVAHLQFNIKPNSNFVNGCKYEVKIEYDNC